MSTRKIATLSSLFILPAPQNAGIPEPPERMGHPSGLPDESNYLKLLLAPLGLYRPLSSFRRPSER